MFEARVSEGGHEDGIDFGFMRSLADHLRRAAVFDEGANGRVLAKRLGHQLCQALFRLRFHLGVQIVCLHAEPLIRGLGHMQQEDFDAGFAMHRGSGMDGGGGAFGKVRRHQDFPPEVRSGWGIHGISWMREP